MNNDKSVHDTSAALPATTFTIPVTFHTGEWPVLVEATASGSWTAHDSEKSVECTITILRHADGRTLVDYRSFENGTYLSSLAVMATTETTVAAIDEVCAHLLANTFGYWGPLVASLREKYAAIPKMKVTTNYASDQSVTINPGEWPVVVEASKEAPFSCNNISMDYNTATVRLHRNADGRVLLHATVTSDNYDGESDFGLFLPADANVCGQDDSNAYLYSIKKFLEFRDQREDWSDLMQKFQSKIDVAFAPTPVKKARKAKKAENVSPSQPRAMAFTSEGGNKMPSPIQ